MGNVITRNARAERIIESGTKALTMASARGGEVKAMAEARLAALAVTLRN